jgi:ribosomal protein S18 acetylase RimI-like enzyme
VSVVLRPHDAAATEEKLDTVIGPVYEASHADVIADPFYSVERFLERVRGYLTAPGFWLVAAYSDDIPIGLAFGYSLPAGSRWWEGATTPLADDFVRETGHRTFALNELMVDPRWQRQGVARSLHDELLGSRLEERATLLVRSDNAGAQAAYARWGWQKVGTLQPYPDAPNFDAMLLPLPL